MGWRSGTRLRLAGSAVIAVLAGWLVGCGGERPQGDVFVARTKGLVYLEQDQLGEAETEFRKVIALAPDDPLGYANLGLVQLRAGRLRDAERQLLRALQRDSTALAPALTLAKVYDLTARRAEARALLGSRLGSPREDPRLLYALAELVEGDVREGYLQRLVDQDPGNLSARLALGAERIRRGNADSVAQQLEAIGQLLPGPPAEALPPLRLALRLLHAGQRDSARVPFDRFRELMEVTPAYQSSFQALAGPPGPLVGFPVLTFRPYYEIRERVSQPAASRDSVIQFHDGTGYSALDSVTAPRSGGRLVLAMGDFDGDGAEDLFTGAGELYRNEFSRFARVTGTGIEAGSSVTWAGFADFDNDGRLDLALLEAEGELRLLRNQTGGRRSAFGDVTAAARLTGVRGRAVLFVDLEHDGDLDLLLATESGVRAFRNNLDGSFQEVTREAGFSGAPITRGGAGIAFGDFTGDGLVDLLVADEERGGVLFRNRGELRFEADSGRSGPAGAPGAGAVAAADYDNDGLLDVVMVGTDGLPRWYRGRSGGGFTPDSGSSKALAGLGGRTFAGAQFLDYDNDGFLDLLLTGARHALLRNDGAGGFDDRSALLPDGDRTGGSVALSDIDRDGDIDLIAQVGGDAAVDRLRLLRNDGGNIHQYLRVSLNALGAGSGKNNAFGIGARLELRVGALYQTRVATSPVTHFGLGKHLKADVIRVVWPNGVPQTIYFPGTDQDVLEEQVLKSSCLFLYAWNGSGYQFVTDVMWRSALGMPIGIGGGGRAAYAPEGASQEYLRIAAAQLKPRNGRYSLQLTEELWETSYLDQARLIAVDHPDSVEVYVDERFIPPAPAKLLLYQVARATPPLTAFDQHGNNLLPALRARDDQYTGPLSPGRFQGLTEVHDLLLDFGPAAPATRGDSLWLFLSGWVFPTDASINVALSQASGAGVVPPSLEVRDAQGNWRVAIPDLGFPSGKDKTLIANLTGKFPTSDRRIRIRTSMDIHWDRAFITAPASPSSVRVSRLDPASAELHYRGFSRMYRKGGRSGPHWFDYGDVSRESRWLAIDGRLTRFGGVLPLLADPDDEYVVMGPGDELTVEFSADRLPPLPAGWTRDFLIYTVGWIKDGDFNTARGGTVGPLPFHGMTGYPYGAGEGYPEDLRHRTYLETYNTRAAAGPPR